MSVFHDSLLSIIHPKTCSRVKFLVGNISVYLLFRMFTMVTKYQFYWDLNVIFIF